MLVDIAPASRLNPSDELYEELFPQLLRREDEILACLSAQERKQLSALLGKIEQSLDLIQTSEEADAKQAY
ncbi:hypothetical protein GA0061099_1006634 [Bradyrhizobium yuanmingense]|uniref:MarR family transcriptional regulator n=1 Tax=Bradyrhizobium yuanmingense TaxID=108015 RepID=A0A1C3WQ07_9BRAD|nr:hypothetical protein IQ15_04127 [Bradyrhizobium yuanmingense]SCB41804.1 hypothetical protein GA0061099_1006634 [Bradyrhizobium yuanmingense]